MFETQKKNNGIYLLATSALCFIAGYSLATYRASNSDIQLTTGPDNSVLLSYQKTPARLLRAENGVATLGLLRERLDDLLNEDPQKIRQLTRDALAR